MTPLDIAGDIRRALALLTRLPVRASFPEAGTAVWVWAFPLVGLIVGGASVGAASGLLALGLPVGAVVIGLGLQVILTGAMHEDGLADTADGLWGGWTPERRLEIMKDSHIGTYGVIALVLAFLWRWSLWGALIGLAPLALIAGAVVSRAAMAGVMAALPHARPSGLSHTTGRPAKMTAMVAAGVSGGIALLCLGLTGALLATLAACAAAMGLALLARAKIGGQTGDILGATQVASEIIVLTVLAAWIMA